MSRRWKAKARRALRAPVVGRAVLLALLCAPLGAVSCRGAGVALPPTSGGSSAGPPLFAARPELTGWMLAPAEGVVGDASATSDGRRSFILRGTRWVDHLDGSLERARQVFQEEDVKFMPLPAHLGGGFLFYATSGTFTSLWRSKTWTGDLKPLGRVEPPVSAITSGFDRLYLSSATSHTLRALDAQTGEARDLAPLPAAAAYGQMVFADAWTAVVLAGVRGALATFDAGESWHPLRAPGPVTELGLSASGAISVSTEGVRLELDATGRLVQTGTRGGDALFAGAETFSRYQREAFADPATAPEASGPWSLSTPSRPALRLGRRPLRAAVLHGWPDSPATAVVIADSALGRVRLRDGKVLGVQPFAGRGPCRGVALGTGFGFVCGDAQGPIEVYSYRHEQLELELSLDVPRAVRSNGNGVLVIDAPCALVRRRGEARRLPASAPPQERGRHCVRQVSGELVEVVAPGDVGGERVAGLRDGRVVILLPPRSNAPGRLLIVTPSGTTSVDLELSATDGPGPRLVRSGLWLDELWEVSEGVLGAWVVGAQSFVGAHVDLEGHVEIAAPQDGVDETSFFGPIALHIAASASVRETIDHGFEWKVSDLPPALVSNSAGTSRTALRGCSAVGCVYDDWLRIGFGGQERDAEPSRPEVPPRVAYPSSGFGFWTLECGPSAAAPARRAGGRAAGTSAAPATAAALARSGKRSATDPRESSAWLPFQGEPAPERRAGDVGYDFGETNELGAYRAYAWGPAAGDWSRRGMWQVRIGDRFSLDGPWSTSTTRSPWSEPGAAAQAFGLDPNTGVDWWLRVGATGRFGVLQIRVRSESTIHLIDRERAITTLEPTAATELGTVAGAYEIRDRWYVGTVRAEQFQLYRVSQNEPELVATYPLWGRIVTQLVHSVAGDELALWQKSSGAGWYVYPIDLETFEPRPALHVPSERLGRVPPACAPGQPGWIAASGVPLTDSAVSESNTHLDFLGGAEAFRTKRLTARVVMDESGVCVDSLAALTEGTPPAAVLRVEELGSRRGALPLTVTDPSDDRRWAFRCAPP